MPGTTQTQPASGFGEVHTAAGATTGGTGGASGVPTMTASGWFGGTQAPPAQTQSAAGRTDGHSFEGGTGGASGSGDGTGVPPLVAIG